MSNDKDFINERNQIAAALAADDDFRGISNEWLSSAQARKYSYQFDWLSRPIIQYPQDIIAMQELIWDVRPDLIIETGVARGGSLIFSASMLALLEMADAITSERTFDPRNPQRRVIGIDIDIRDHNRTAIESHPMSVGIDMIEGSSVEPDIIDLVKQKASKFNKVLVMLDSNHTHEHVLSELKAYADLTSVGSYCVVFDTLIEYLPNEQFDDRPWGVGNNPMTAVTEFLSSNNNFEIDKSIDHRIQISVATNGFLKRTA